MLRSPTDSPKNLVLRHASAVGACSCFTNKSHKKPAHKKTPKASLSERTAPGRHLLYCITNVMSHTISACRSDDPLFLDTCSLPTHDHGLGSGIG